MGHLAIALLPNHWALSSKGRDDRQLRRRHSTFLDFVNMALLAFAMRGISAGTAYAI